LVPTPISGETTIPNNILETPNPPFGGPQISSKPHRGLGNFEKENKIPPKGLPNSPQSIPPFGPL